MRPIAKSAKRLVRSTESSHIVNATIRLTGNVVAYCLGNLIPIVKGLFRCNNADKPWPWTVNSAGRITIGIYECNKMNKS